MIGTCDCAPAQEQRATLGSPIGLSIPPKAFRAQGRLVIRSPEQLRLHPTVVRMNLANSLVEGTGASHLDEVPTAKPILVTANGTIISGFRDWQAALSDLCASVNCIEYCLSDEEALQSVLINQRPRRFWNSFTRIRLALELEPYFRAKAVSNQSHGGKFKGSASLPKAECMEARREVARLAGVGARNVSNVKTILEKGHPRLIDALQDGTLSIGGALRLCSLSRTQQLDQLLSNAVDRATSKVTRRAVAQLRMQRLEEHPIGVIKVLQELATRDPGSIVVRRGSRQQTVILLGRTNPQWSLRSSDKPRATQADCQPDAVSLGPRWSSSGSTPRFSQSAWLSDRGIGR